MKETLLLIKYLGIFLLIRLPMTLSGMIILALVLPFISKKRETLPRAFRWYDNIWAHKYGKPDYTSQELFNDNTPTVYGRSPKIDGLSGPPRWRWPIQWQLERGYDMKEIHEGYTGYPFIEYNYFKHLYQRYRWLAFRNPVNYFSYMVLGKKIESDFKLIYSRGKQYKDIHIHRTLANNASQSVYELSMSGNYSLLGIRRNLDLRMGYKIRPIGDEKLGDTLQFTFRFNPFRSPK